MIRPDLTDDFKNIVLSDYPRLSLQSKFQFRCGPGVPCFNACCRDVNIVLTPYDILRLKNRLGMDSGSFLAKYTLVPFTRDQRIPVVFLRMSDTEQKTCPFVSDKGCTVYEDRPWPCRIYPLGLASPRDNQLQGEPFYFLLQEDHCQGHRENKQYSVQEWLSDQRINDYNLEGELFKEISMHSFLFSHNLDPAKMEMFYMAAYNLDKFRAFIFQSTFLTRFEIEPEVILAIKQNDLDLLHFAYRWLRFAIFGEHTIRVSEEQLSEPERERYKKNIDQ